MPGHLTHLHIETGPAGWLKAFWRRDNGPDNAIFVRFRAPESKRKGWAPIGLQASKDSYPRWLSSDLVRDVPLHRIDSAVALSTGFRRDLLERIDEDQPSDLDKAFKRAYSEAPRTLTRLERPKRSELSDEFFRKVATAYRWAVAAGLPPGKTIAHDSGIPQGTVARWIAEARAKGFLPAAEPGKVSRDV
jgi:hypothetical protein